MQQFDKDTFFIWSNARPYDNATEYHDAILSNNVFSNSINVFLNKMYPFTVAEEIFNAENSYAFHMSCDSKYGWGGCHGGEMVKNDKIPFVNHYMQYRKETDSTVSKILDVDEKNKIFTVEHVCNLDFSDIDYPKACKCGASGGFTAYLFVKQYFNPKRIILCNFGIEDGWGKKFKKLHDLKFEQKYYKENKICQMRI